MLPNQRIRLDEQRARVLDLLLLVLRSGPLMAAAARPPVPLLRVLGGRALVGRRRRRRFRLFALLLVRGRRLGSRLGRPRPAARFRLRRLLFDGRRLDRLHPLFHLVRDTAAGRMICESIYPRTTGVSKIVLYASMKSYAYN